MTVTLQLKPEVEALLQAQAEINGVPVEDYLRSLIENALSPLALDKAIALYTARTVTQGQAAALAGVSRADFVDALNKAGVSVFQYDSPEELIEEISHA